jgi:hypothetical protein
VMSDPRIKPRIVSSFRCMTDVTVKATRYAAAAAARSVSIAVCVCGRTLFDSHERPMTLLLILKFCRANTD